MNNGLSALYIAGAAAILLFVVLSAFFSSAEIAFAKCNRLRFEKAAENGDRTAGKVLDICENYVTSLSTVLVGNNLVNIAASSVATVMAVSLLGRARGETAATVVTTAVVLVFGETLPKIIAAAVPDSAARLYAGPMRLCMKIFRPVVFVTDKLVNGLSVIWTPKEETPNVTSEELCEILDDIEEEGVFSEDESELIKSAIEFTDTMAKDILVPRVDVFALDIDEPFEFTGEVFKHTRIPVYEGSIDNIIGIVSAKQLLKTIASGGEPDLRRLMYEPVFVHMTRTVSSIIEEFRQKHQQLAVVLDEYGGTMGILTLEDITEEIVGEIFDERDSVEISVVPLGGNVFEVDGGMNVFDMFDELEFDEPSDFDTEYTTVGGWVTQMLDKFPEQGDSFEYESLRVAVKETQGKRVLSVTVEIIPETEEDINEKQQ